MGLLVFVRSALVVFDAAEGKCWFEEERATIRWRRGQKGGRMESVGKQGR